MTLNVLTLIAAILIPQQQVAALASGTARIHGRVVSADGGAAIRGATVTLTTGPAASVTATTDGDGRFDAPKLAPGNYRIRVSKAGFVTTLFGAADGKVGGFALAAGQQLDRGDLALPRGGVMTGRIFDEFGEPAAGVSVQALRSSYINPGNRRLVTDGSAETNDIGEFRIFGLRPGQYFVVASVRRMQMGAAESGVPASQFTASVQGSAPTFYPGTSDAGAARAVSVAAGRETSGLDLRLLAVPLARISGTVVNVSGKPPTGMFVWLNPVRNDGAFLPLLTTAELDAQGRFTIPNVAPGDYRVDVESLARMEAIAKTGSNGIGYGLDAAEYRSASVPVSVNGQDIEGLAIQVGRATRLTGTITVDGLPPAAPVAAAANVSVSAPYTGLSASLQAAWGKVNPDGTFAVNSSAGVRLLRVSGLPNTLVLKSVRARGIDVTDSGFDVGREDITDVAIELTATPTRVTGGARDPEGAPVRQYSVIVFTEDRSLWTAMMNRVVVSATAGADGMFSVAGLPAGSYFAAAVESLTDGEWAEPANLERLRATATSFKLGDGEQKTLTLTLRK